MVRTRFAPSPTGYLHIGGVRTALFNWLFARKHGGQFVLRIDDTDQKRNVAEALAPILHGFRWLGLDWDEGAEVGGPCGPYYQSQKLERYQAAVRELVEKGHAYWDYATEQEVKAEREAATAEKRPYLYSRRWMAETPAQRAKFEAEGRNGIVRLKMPRERACSFFDHIRGEQSVEWATEQDHVIKRADGSVMYNLATVVDDFDMKITHVIRASEHLPNTPRQIFALEGLGYPRPEYAHLPAVAEPGSKEKLSKRKIAQYLKNPDFKKSYDHGQAIAAKLGLASTPENFNPVLVEFYEQVGYLPDAILNYLMLLGWAHEDGKSEFFTRAEMIDVFTLERVSKGPASFDAKKLLAFQERYIQLLPVEERVTRVLPYLARAGLVADPVPSAARELVTRIVADAGPRLVVAGDILNFDDFFLPDDKLPYDDKALDKHVRKNTEVLKKARAVLANTAFDPPALKAAVEAFATAEGVKPGPVSQMLRVAATGKDVGFGTYETLAILGRARCLARIDRALRRV
ncbi:MAG: glutamate--tRNA ligase [Gemmataceae bacterium]